MAERNELGLKIGEPVVGWSPPATPPKKTMEGTFCRLEPLDPGRHSAQLNAANSQDAENRIWTYLGYGPFESEEEYRNWVKTSASSDDPLFFAIIDQSLGLAVGVASFLRIEPQNGTIEVGHLNFAPPLQATPAATEAMYLMMSCAFTLGYRRYEWKCDSLNERSRRAAERYGFTFEGIFRQATIYKGRNRDTAWYSILDKEWPIIKSAFEAWLNPDNFDANGQQRASLSSFRE